jgi:hypothetical protein
MYQRNSRKPSNGIRINQREKIKIISRRISQIYAENQRQSARKIVSPYNKDYFFMEQ